jgi:uncharacterized protein
MVDRMCIVTREVLAEEDLVRFVLSPDGIVTPDLHRVLPGRGVWVGLSQEKVQDAVKRKLFARGFGSAVTVPEDLAALVERQLRAQAVATLSLCRKAGMAVAGFMKVEDHLKRNVSGLLIHAPEAGADGVRKLNRLVREPSQVTDAFSAEELNLAFGQSNVIHAAIASGTLAHKLHLQIDRMVRYRGKNTSAFQMLTGLKDEAI